MVSCSADELDGRVDGLGGLRSWVCGCCCMPSFCVGPVDLSPPVDVDVDVDVADADEARRSSPAMTFATLTPPFFLARLLWTLASSNNASSFCRFRGLVGERGGRKWPSICLAPSAEERAGGKGF